MPFSFFSTQPLLGFGVEVGCGVAVGLGGVGLGGVGVDVGAGVAGGGGNRLVGTVAGRSEGLSLLASVPPSP